MTNKDLIISFLANVKVDIVADIRSKGISNGDLDMEIDANEAGGNLSGASYYYYLVHGRKPGKQPPIDSILGWIQKKGIAPTDITQRSLAFLIARKIGKVGTDIYTGKRQGLALEQIIALNGVQFKGELTDKYRQEITKTVGETLRKVFTQPATV